MRWLIDRLAIVKPYGIYQGWSVKNTVNRTFCSLAIAGVLMLSACGGGEPLTQASAPLTSTQLGGTAAIGAPISGVVTAIDINGKSSPPATTTAQGAFVVDVGGMQAPFILNIVGTSGGSQVTLNSIATAPGQTVNITPLTDLIVATASGQPAGETLAALCAPVNNVAPAACLSALNTAQSPANLANAVNAVKAMIAPLNVGSVDPLNGSFAANGAGFDKILDQIKVSPAQGQGGTATVTLIATNTPLGQVQLQGPGVPQNITIPPSPDPQLLLKANAAADAFSEIQACLNSFSALYAAPSAGVAFSPPTSNRVSEFIDPAFVFGNQTYASFITNFSASNAREGFAMKAVSLAPVDMSPFGNAELSGIDPTSVHLSGSAIFKSRSTAAIDLASTPNTAWIRLKIAGSPSLDNVKVIRGTPYAGCQGGWKLAGSQHISMHMNSRVTRVNGNITREWALHIDFGEVSAIAGAQRVKVGGPGLSLYDASAVNGVGAASSVDLVAGNTASMTLSSLGTGLVYKLGTDAIRSCQDLKVAAIPSTENGVPCMDETKAAPGQTYLWYLRTAVAGDKPVAAFPFQTSAVPLSTAFVQANASAVFATIGNFNPPNLASFGDKLNQSLLNQITINFSVNSTYGATPEHCGVLLLASDNSVLLNGEQQPPKGLSTTCIFNAPESVTTTSTAFGINALPANGTIGVATTVLGNQAVNAQSLN